MGNVFGFRSMPPRALTYAHPFSGAAIATPVLDLLMRQDNGVVTDRTGYCLVPGTRGFFSEGYMKVEEAFDNGVTGILQDAGEIGQIRKAYSRQYNGQVFSMKTRVCPRVTLTRGHKVLVLKEADVLRYRLDESRGRVPHFPLPIWTCVEDLCTGDMVLVPRPHISGLDQMIDFGIATDKDRCFLAFSQGKTPNDMYSEVNVLHASVDRYAAAWHAGANDKWVKYPAFSPMVLDADMCRFFGWYVAEGNADAKSGHIVLTLGYNESDATAWISEYATRVFGVSVCVTAREQDHTRRIHFSSQKLASFLITAFGHGARNKHLPSWILNSTDACAVAFISAFIDGDGCVLDRAKSGYKPRISIITSSERMVCDLTALLMRLDVLPMIHHMNKEGDFEFEPGRVVHQHDGWEVRITGDDVNKLRPNLSDTSLPRRYLSDENFFYCRISKVEESRYDGPVYDFETDTHTLGMPFIIHNSNNGVCSGCVGAKGVFDEGQKFAGSPVNTINCGLNPSLGIAQDISVGAWIYSRGAALENIMGKADGGANGWGFFIDAAGRLWAYFYIDASSVTGVNVVRNRWAHAWMAVQNGVCRIFADGLQEARGAVTMSNFAAGQLFVSWNAAFPFTGSVELPQVFSGALSPEQVYRKYLEAKDVPIYLDDFSSYAVTPVAKAVGSMCGPYRIIFGTTTITVDVAGKKWYANTAAAVGSGQWPIVNDGPYGTWEFDTTKVEWTGGASAFLVASSVPGNYNTAGQNSYFVYMVGAAGVSNLFFYRSTAAVATLLFTAAVNTIVQNTDYRLRIVRRVGGQWTLYIKGGLYPDWVLVAGAATGQPFTDNNHTTGMPHFAFSGNAGDRTSGIKKLRVCERPASFPWEFSTGTYSGVVSGTTVWMNCLTAGVTYLPKDLDWLQMNFGIYKGADANVTDLLFMATEIGGTTFANQNGYSLRLAADESIQLIRMSAGVETILDTTAAGYIAINTEYEIKITHDWSLHMFAFYIRGGAYADWTLFSQFGLGIYSSSNYTIWDLDADDRATAPTFRSVPR